MNFSTAAWLSILSIGFLFISFLFEKGIFYNVEYFHTDCSRLKLQYLFFGLGLLCCFLMVLQGSHLLIEGYQWDGYINGSNITGAQLGKLSVKARGKGAIFVLAYRLFQNYTPQMIIFGYGYIIWKYKDELKDIYPIIFKTKEFYKPIIDRVMSHRGYVSRFQTTDEKIIHIERKLKGKWTRRALATYLKNLKEKKIKECEELKDKGLITEEELLAITRKLRGIDHIR